MVKETPYDDSSSSSKNRRIILIDIGKITVISVLIFTTHTTNSHAETFYFCNSDESIVREKECEYQCVCVVHLFVFTFLSKMGAQNVDIFFFFGFHYLLPSSFD
jgi:hypothetical protein